MSSSVHLAFDLGAESGRALAGELDQGRLRIREVSRFANGILHLRGRACWNVFRLYEHLVAALAQCGREGLAPDTIGVDTWGVDFALNWSLPPTRLPFTSISANYLGLMREVGRLCSIGTAISMLKAWIASTFLVSASSWER